MGYHIRLRQWAYIIRLLEPRRTFLFGVGGFIIIIITLLSHKYIPIGGEYIFLFLHYIWIYSNIHSSIYSPWNVNGPSPRHLISRSTPSLSYINIYTSLLYCYYCHYASLFLFFYFCHYYYFIKFRINFFCSKCIFDYIIWMFEINRTESWLIIAQNFIEFSLTLPRMN